MRSAVQICESFAAIIRSGAARYIEPETSFTSGPSADRTAGSSARNTILDTIRALPEGAGDTTFPENVTDT
ncbi:MAG: hypothetical protein DI527_20225 [Chelatococcus sp.]|nr:MAG: hypothetical protein DI527_20225 [Chelatococcus sp.]